jgi:diguanylate cyclase (GGDEF)-like protein/PAS domain S-box-containing protein
MWAKALSSTAYVPSTRRDVERLLSDLLNELFESVTADGFSPGPAREVGVRLVTENFTAEQSLSHTVEVLGQALPVHPDLQNVDRLASKVNSVLGALSAGFAAALRARTLDQQEQVKRALLRAREDAERGLRVSESKFRELFTSSAVGIAISDLDGELVEVNQALSEIIGAPAAHLARRSLYDLFHPGDLGLLRTAQRDLVARGQPRRRLPQRLRLIDKEGEPAWAYLAMSVLHDADGAATHLVTIVEDVTELHLLGERLRHQSLHDALTGLPNQQFFVTSLERALGTGGRVTVCTIDLDGFAVVNDGYGRQVGDQLLQWVAARLRSVVAGEQATVARFGADRFAILIENSPTTPDVAALATRINTELAEPVYINGHGLAVSCGMGIAVHQGGAATHPAELLRAAEATLHGVKRRSKHQWGLFDPQLDAGHRAHSRLAAAMPGAWESGEIGLDYQPLARLSDGTVVGFHALLHWDHPQRGRLPHQECLELAALTGLILPLGQWVLHQVCAQIASWHQQAGVIPPVHVDLSRQHAHDPDLVTTVRCALDRVNIAPACLQLGIPVSALDDEQGEATENLQVLADMGVAITLLECSGADAVAHLEDLPVLAVQLASRMVRRVITRGGDSAVARSATPLVTLMQCCGATVMVRDIDTRRQADWWRSAGVDIGQGGFFALPGPPDAALVLLD